MKKEDLEAIAALVVDKLRGEGAPTREVRESMQTLTARVPRELIDLLDRIGGETKQSRSEVLRDILRETSTKRARK